LKRVVQIVFLGAYIWFLLTYLMTPTYAVLWKTEWVRILLYSIVPILIWENVPKLIPKKKFKKTNYK
jgi:hypothetical protein